MSSEIQYKNSFGTGFIDSQEAYQMIIKNLSQKHELTLRGDSAAVKAFEGFSKERIPYSWNTELKQWLSEGKNVYEIELIHPDRTRQKIAIASYEEVIKMFNDCGINPMGKWKSKTWNKETNRYETKQVI